MKKMKSVIENQPTIDPETLPIVQELRAELSKVTVERDAAIADLEMLKVSISCESNQSYSSKPFIECYKNGKKKHCRWS